MQATKEQLQNSINLADQLGKALGELNRVAAHENTIAGNLISNQAIENLITAAQLEAQLKSILTCFNIEQ